MTYSDISLEKSAQGCQAPAFCLSTVLRNPLVCEALKLGCRVVSTGARILKSPGFIIPTVNEDKAKSAFSEDFQVRGFSEYRMRLSDKRVLVESLVDGKLARLVNPADSSRYFSNGRRRVKARIRRRLGSWYNCPGLLVTLTYAPSMISRRDAWLDCRRRGREFVNVVNRWRVRHGMPRAKFLSVIEEQWDVRKQKGTQYPHLHLVFPYLKWLCPLDFMTEAWGQAVNSVDVKVRDSFSPVSYVCKYVSKLDGWTDLALSYLWANRTRLYTMSRDYSLPDYSDKRVPEWQFKRRMSVDRAVYFLRGLGDYDTVLGADDLVQLVLKGGVG